MFRRVCVNKKFTTKQRNNEREKRQSSPAGIQREQLLCFLSRVWQSVSASGIVFSLSYSLLFFSSSFFALPRHLSPDKRKMEDKKKKKKRENESKKEKVKNKSCHGNDGRVYTDNKSTRYSLNAPIQQQAETINTNILFDNNKTLSAAHIAPDIDVT